MRIPTTSRRKGQALVEAALSMTVFLTMLLGILDFGQYLYFQQTLTERTRAAARVAILDPTKVDNIKNFARFNTTTPAEGASPVLPGLTAAMISVTTANLGTPEGRVTVTISGFPIKFVTPFLAGSINAPICTVTYPSEAPW
jgi:Flp pilus assembly protein TadG